MKRLFTIITLLVSSFFLFSIKEVSADTIEYTVNDTHYEFINEDFFKLRELVINYVNENNKYYVIYNNSYGSSLRASVFDCSYLEMLGSNLYNNCEFINYRLSNDKLSLQQSGTGTSFSTPYTNTRVYYSYAFMDTNIKDISSTVTNTYIIKYNDLTYTIEPGNILPTLYQIYLDNNIPDEPEEPPVVEIEALSSFYFTVIEKINFLAMSMLSNQVYLSVIGIFILIFIIELIFRRYL